MDQQIGYESEIFQVLDTLPRDPGSPSENGFMEPKYYAFRFGDWTPQPLILWQDGPRWSITWGWCWNQWLRCRMDFRGWLGVYMFNWITWRSFLQFQIGLWIWIQYSELTNFAEDGECSALKSRTMFYFSLCFFASAWKKMSAWRKGNGRQYNLWISIRH